MKSITIIFLMAAASLTAQQSLKNELDSWVKKLDASFESGKWTNVRTHYSTTSSEIGPFGEVTNGATDLEASYNQFAAMWEGKPTMTHSITSWKNLGNDMVLIYLDGHHAFKMMGQEYNMELTLSALLVKKGGQWLLEHAQLTPRKQFLIPSIEEGEILKLRTEAYAAYRALDAKRFGNVFTDKVYFTSPYGQRASTKEEVVVMHENLFPLFANGKVISDDIIDYKVSFMAPEVAIAQWFDISVYEQNGKETKEKLIMNCVFVKTSEGWKISSFSMVPVPANFEGVK